MSREPEPLSKDFTPPLGIAFLTPLYNTAIAIFTREGAWRNHLVRHLAPQSKDFILDIGCGTGSLVHYIYRECPDATYIGVDPDREALSIARRRAEKERIPARFIQGFFDGTLALESDTPNKIVITLVLHQTPLEEKRRIINHAFKTLPKTRVLLIADYGLQRSRLVRFLFRWTVQALDGLEPTQPNAEGVLPILLKQAGFAHVIETKSFATPSGSISVLHAIKEHFGTGQSESA